MHLTPANARRVVDTALTLTAQPPLSNVGDDRTDAEVFEIPALGPAWQLALRGLDTRLNPGELRHGHVRRPGGGRARATWSTSTSGTRCCSAPPASCAPRCSAWTRRCTG